MPTVPRSHPIPRPSRRVRAARRLRALTAAGIAGVAALAPALPAAAAPTTPAPACATTPFTAQAAADLLKLTALDINPLGLDLPALLDARLAAARAEVDSAAAPYKTTATARYADARLLGLQIAGLPLPDSVASQQAPHPSHGAADNLGPHQVTLGSLEANGILGVTLGKSTAEARWNDQYRCGGTGPLTRSATTLADVSILDGGGPVPAIQAVTRATGTAEKTSLVRLGPNAAAQTTSDVVPLGGGRVGVAAGAGAALTDLSLFDGTDQEISVKVVTQPKLIAVAAGTARDSAVRYEPATLKVTAAGRPVANLDAGGTSVTLNLFGRMAPGQNVIPKGNSLLNVRLSLGSLEQQITDKRVSAEAATLRVEVMLGSAHLLDLALGNLSVAASAPVITTPATPDAPQGGTAGSDESLPLTGANTGVMAGVGGGLLAVGAAILLAVRRRRVHLRAE